MKKRTFRLGWLIAVGAMTALACTCGALGQAQQTVQTAQAVASQVQQFSTEAEGFATEFEESGFQETAEAIGTQSEDVPDDIPVFPQNENMFAFDGTLTFFSSASFQEVVDFYKQEMPNNGWSEAEVSVETADSVVLVFSKEGRKANVTLNNTGGQVQVLIVTEGN